jgi:hypothetical protein
VRETLEGKNRKGFLMKTLCLLVVFLAAASSAASQSPQSSSFKPGAKVFVHPMSDGFDTYIKEALVKKKVPVVVVDTSDQAQFEIKGTSETQKAGAAKKIFMGNWHSDEQASISVTSVQSGEIVYAYSANKKNSAHGKQTSAEACAKHLKEAIEKNK